MSKEIELKMVLSPEGPERLLAHPLLHGMEAQSRTLGNLYYDTPEGALESARVALRVRRIGAGNAADRLVQTLKSAARSHGGLSSRGEWEWPIEDADRNDVGLDLNGLRALGHPALKSVDLERLRPVFSTDFERRLWHWRDGDDAVEIALDQGEIRAGTASLPICELELELKSGHPDALWNVVERLCDGQPSLPARPANHSKASRANALRHDWPRPEVPSAVTLDDVIDAIDWWQDSQDSAWHAAAVARLTTLFESAPTESARRLVTSLTAGRLPWQSKDWLRLRRTS